MESVDIWPTSMLVDDAFNRHIVVSISVSRQLFMIQKSDLLFRIIIGIRMIGAS